MGGYVNIKQASARGHGNAQKPNRPSSRPKRSLDFAALRAAPPETTE